MEDASTMAQVDHQTADVGIQVQEWALNEGSRKNAEDARKIDEAIQGTSESCKGGEAVIEPTEKDNNKRKAEDGEQETDLRNRNEKARRKGKKCEKGKRKPKASRQRKSVFTLQERAAPPNEVSAISEKHEELHDRIKVVDTWLVSSALQKDDVPLQYSKTPRLRKKSDESNNSCENMAETPDINTCTSVRDAQALMAETNTIKKHGEVLSEGIPQLAVCLEDTENERVVKSDEEVREAGLNDREDSARILQQQSVKEQQSHVLMEEKEEGGFESKMPGSERVLNVKEKKEKTKRTKKTKEVELAEEKLSQDENSVEKENGETRRQDKANKNQNGRVLRSRAEKRSSVVEMDPFKGHREDRNNKSLDKRSRQIPHDSNETVATKKRKTDDSCLKGHEPAMLLTSSPEDHQCPHETELSSREIDTLDDEARPLRGVMTLATTVDTSQQPETEIQRELTEAAQSERLGDYNSGQGSLVLSDNRIKEVGKKISLECLHSSLEEVKSGRSSFEENGNKKSERKNNEKKELSSKKCKRSKQGRKKAEYKKQDSSAVDLRDSHTLSTSNKVKSTASDKGHWKRKRQNPSEQPAAVKDAEKTDAVPKENKPNGTTAEKKR